MALFEPQHYGQRISERLSEYLMDYSTPAERAEVNEKLSLCSLSLIEKVVACRATLSERSAPVLIEIMRVAIQNSMRRKEHAERANNYLINSLPVEFEVVK